MTKEIDWTTMPDLSKPLTKDDMERLAEWAKANGVPVSFAAGFVGAAHRKLGATDGGA